MAQANAQKRANAKEITSTKQLREGSRVLEKDGYIGVVYMVYSDTKVSLCLADYESKNDMFERDFQTDIKDLKLIKY